MPQKCVNHENFKGYLTPFGIYSSSKNCVEWPPLPPKRLWIC